MKVLKKSVGFFIVLCSIPLLATTVGIATFHAQEETATLQSQQPQWSPGVGLYLNNKKFVALDSNEGALNFLSVELTGSTTYEQSVAEGQARSYAQGRLLKAERAIIQGSDLPSTSDFNEIVVGGHLPSFIPDVKYDWWLIDKETVEGYLLGKFVSNTGDTADSSQAVIVEKQTGTECKNTTLATAGFALSSKNNWPDAGEGTSGKPAKTVTCPRVTIDTFFQHKYRYYTKSTACTGTYTVEDDYNTWALQPWYNVTLDRCVDTENVVKPGNCYAMQMGRSLFLESGSEWTSATANGTATITIDGHQVTKKCKGPISGARGLGIRPKLTLNPQSLIIESMPVSAQPDTEVNTSLKVYSAGNHEMVAGTDYKLRLFDADQNVQQVRKPSTVQEKLFDVKGTTVQIEKGTTQVTLDTMVNGTHNYISAMARDIDNNTTLYGKIGQHTGTGNTTSITLDLSKIMDTSKQGTTKQVNLYSEQINGEHESDLVSSKPLTVTFEVLEPRKEQKLSFDENNAREMMYGDTITLKANVNDADTTKGWAADTNPVFALVGDPTKSPVTLENSQFDAATGIATVTLKARNVDAAEVTLSLNKAGSDAQPVRYDKADEITTTIKINKRAITVTPKKVILGIGDAYPPIWEFDTVMTDTSNKAKALVDGDVLPYTVKTSALEIGQSDEPVLDQDNKITIANKAKKWGLSVSNGDTAQAAAIEAFEKKYDVKKNDYDGINNKKSRLEISSIRYDGIQFIKHPDDVTTLDEETFTFTAVATYPTKTIDDKDVSLDEQSITYQWQYSEDGNDWKDIPAGVGTPTADYKDGEATFTYTKTAEAADTKKQYRCTAKNKRDVEDGVTAMSNPAGLIVTMEPLTFIQIPQSVELVEDKNREFAKNKTADEANAIKLNEYKNTVSENKETTSQVPEGEFKIYVQTPFYLTLNKDEKQHDKKYQVTVTDANDKTLTTKLEADKYLLTSLSYKTDKKQDTFTLKTPVDRKKTVGTYTGDMVFTIQYVKPSGGS